MRRVVSLWLPFWPTDRLRQSSHAALPVDAALVTRGHDGRRMGIVAQVHHRLSGRIALGHGEAPVRSLADQVGVAGVAVGRPVPLQGGKPGLLHELEEARRRRGRRMRERVEAALPLGGPEQESEVDPRGAGRAADGRLDPGERACGADVHGQFLPSRWLT